MLFLPMACAANAIPTQYPKCNKCHQTSSGLPISWWGEETPALPKWVGGVTQQARMVLSSPRG